jgi:hypothetical protein
MGDNAVCTGPPDAIAKGAFPVPISGKPAARMTDTTVHGGVIVSGCPTVLIGLAGTAGNVRVGTMMCNAAAGGRTSGTTGQSYNNCGVESSRQVINQANNSNITENQLLQTAIDNGWAGGTPGSAPVFENGGTSAAGRMSILGNSGVASTVQPSNLNNMGLALSQGKGVIANVDAHYLWMQPDGSSLAPKGSGHAITVTGIEYNDNGDVTHVIINDTGVGECGQRVPVNDWNEAVNNRVANGLSSSELNVTDNPIF